MSKPRMPEVGDIIDTGPTGLFRLITVEQPHSKAFNLRLGVMTNWSTNGMINLIRCTQWKIKPDPIDALIETLEEVQ